MGAGLCYGIYTVAAKVATTRSVDMTAVAGVTLLLGCLPALDGEQRAQHPAPA